MGPARMREGPQPLVASARRAFGAATVCFRPQAAQALSLDISGEQTMFIPQPCASKGGLLWCFEFASFHGSTNRVIKTDKKMKNIAEKLSFLVKNL